MNNSKKYAWDAKDYSKNSQNQFQWSKELIPKLKLQGNEALLDLGCGDGKITAELTKCMPHGSTVGIDSSAQMINLAQINFPKKDYPNLDFQVMDVRKLCFREEFDLIFSNATLHWIIDQKPVLDGVKSTLKPLERFVVQMVEKATPKT